MRSLQKQSIFRESKIALSAEAIDISRIKNRALCRSNRYFTNQKSRSLQKQSIFRESRNALSAEAIDISRIKKSRSLQKQSIFYESKITLGPPAPPYNAEKASNFFRAACQPERRADRNRRRSQPACTSKSKACMQLHAINIIICVHWQLITCRFFGPSENHYNLLRGF